MIRPSGENSIELITPECAVDIGARSRSDSIDQNLAWPESFAVISVEPSGDTADMRPSGAPVLDSASTDHVAAFQRMRPLCPAIATTRDPSGVYRGTVIAPAPRTDRRVRPDAASQIVMAPDVSSAVMIDFPSGEKRAAFTMPSCFS